MLNHNEPLDITPKAANTRAYKDYVEIDLAPWINGDKVDEYFKVKDSIRALNNNLKDIKATVPEIEELKKIMKKVTELRERIADNNDIRIISDKIKTQKERKELLLELIRIDLLEHSHEEIKRNGRKLKLQTILKELRDNDEDRNRSPFRVPYTSSRQIGLMS